MKILLSFISIIALIGLSSCVEEEGGAGSGSEEKPRDSKFLVPTKAQSSAQAKQHKAADKKLISSKKANKKSNSSKEANQRSNSSKEAKEEPCPLDE